MSNVGNYRKHMFTNHKFLNLERLVDYVRDKEREITLSGTS